MGNRQGDSIAIAMHFSLGWGSQRCEEGTTLEERILVKRARATSDCCCLLKDRINFGIEQSRDTGHHLMDLLSAQLGLDLMILVGF
jgi:hypothetical protein